MTEPTVFNPGGKRRVFVTKELPGKHWIEVLTAADCRIEVAPGTEILSKEAILSAIGDRCDAVIGQLTEPWGGELFAALKAAGGTAYSNYAVGYNNVDVAAATKCGIPVGNTPGVLTETTAEMAIALTFSASRRVVEADRFMRSGKFHGWLPTMFMGQLFHGKTVGIIGAGRIGAAYGRMMVEGHKMNLVYYDLHPNQQLEGYIADYASLLEKNGEPPVTCRRVETVEDLLREADLVSIHTVLDDSTRHLINTGRLALMKPDAVLVNTARGPIIDEAALVAHCQANPDFRVGLDVFENEPAMAPGLAELDNVVIVPHIASATTWTRQGMASLAACNVAAILQGHPVWKGNDVLPFLQGEPPAAAPSIVNAADLGLS
ncbi:MAG TPA: NAD(P)-dependent oxidoreductase [Luteolibacter sp.]|nr:NAD(P)-dependent oxidoreductase [Luteolibacter sp.]